ncbi:MAG: hypothetical protein ABR910_13720 [Acidobacteriaceae bacterium]|jgi:hypothetical protein
MPNPFRRAGFACAGPLVTGSLLCLLSLSLTAPRAIGQDTPAPLTPFQRQMARIDLAIDAAGSLTSATSGIEKRDGTPLTIKASTTVGELFTLRYTARPWVGFEFNFGNVRTTQNYTFGPPTPNVLPGGAQTNVRELSLGYVAHPPHQIFGIQPFLGAGIATIRFKPTPFGGEGLPFQYRAAYYYHGGLDYTFPDSHFGVRLGFRQLIYLAPDFQQNYLTITRRVRTSEPTFGFFLRF